jgi:hypothetical protein
VFKGFCSKDRLINFVVINIENTDFNTNMSRAAEKQKFKMV